MSQYKDQLLIKKWDEEIYSEYGKDAELAKNFIFEEAQKGEIIVCKIIKGEKITEEQGNNHKYLTDLILKIMYFQFVIQSTLKLFSEWESDELDDKNKQLGENTYLRLADSCKVYHKIQSSNIIENILIDILEIRLKNKFSAEACKEVLKIYKKIVGTKLLEAKLIKSLKGYVDM